MNQSNLPSDVLQLNAKVLTPISTFADEGDLAYDNIMERVIQNTDKGIPVILSDQGRFFIVHEMDREFLFGDIEKYIPKKTEFKPAKIYYLEEDCMANCVTDRFSIRDLYEKCEDENAELILYIRGIDSYGSIEIDDWDRGATVSASGFIPSMELMSAGYDVETIHEYELTRPKFLQKRKEFVEDPENKNRHELFWIDHSPMNEFYQYNQKTNKMEYVTLSGLFGSVY